MRYLIAAALIVLLAASTASAQCGCYAPAPVVVHSYYPAAPYCAYRPAVVYPTPAYYPPAYYGPAYRAAYYGPYARPWVGPLGRLRASYYWGW